MQFSGFIPPWRSDLAHLWVEKNWFSGYLAVAPNLYGKGVFGADIPSCFRLMKPFIDDRKMLADRLRACLDFVQGLDKVDGSKVYEFSVYLESSWYNIIQLFYMKNWVWNRQFQVSAVGYCFGGLCALDMARLDLGLKSVVSFHGALIQPKYDTVERFTTKVLMFHGDLDSHITKQHVNLNFFTNYWTIVALSYAY